MFSCYTQQHLNLSDKVTRGSLIRYIDTYRDPHAEGVEEEEIEPKKKPWWKGGGAVAGKKFSDFATPTDWLSTDMREGLNDTEVERRRKQSGWNELSAEKENMVSARDLAAFRQYGLADYPSFSNSLASSKDQFSTSWRRLP